MTNRELIRSVFLTAGLAATALGGPLNPPNGPITSTYKTLTEVEPRTAINADNTPGDADSVFKITAPGSYYLTAGFFATPGKHGIEIDASNITIDLNGFRIGGQNGSLDGIHITGAEFGITIRGGVIFTVGGDGIDGVDSSAMRVEDVTVLNSGGQGIVVGVANEIFRCTVATNGSHGINTGDTCTVAGSVARGNGGVGIDVDDNSTITGCTAAENDGHGISLNTNGRIAGSTSLLNGQDGIRGDTGTTYSDCAARQNTGYGIHTGNGFATLSGCTAQSNTLDGFYTAERSTLVNCSAGGNTQSGFFLLHGNVVKNCSAAFNGTRGVTIDGGSNLVSESNFTQNGSSGIGILSNVGNRIESNNCSFNAFGIFINAASNSNLVVKNSCKSNSTLNFSIPATNDYGAILVSPGAAFTSSNSWANFEF